MDAILQWFLNLFTAQEWRAFIWLILATLAATHTIKVAWRLSPWRGGSHAHVYLLSSLSSFILSYFIWPADSSGMWWIAGLVGGPASNVAFKVFYRVLKRYHPNVASVMNGDRRKDPMPIPPTSTPERRK